MSESVRAAPWLAPLWSLSLPVVVVTDPAGVSWSVWHQTDDCPCEPGPHWMFVAEGRGRMVEWHRVGCRCEAPGVGP